MAMGRSEPAASFWAHQGDRRKFSGPRVEDNSVSERQIPAEAGRESVAQGPVQLHSVTEACRMLGGMGRTWFYGEVAAKRIRTVKLGSRTLVPDSELRRYIAEVAASGDH